jgi:hypothetical protein
MAAAAQAIKNVSLELGGKSPFVVFADSDIEAAVEWIMFGIFWNQGQVCSATSRVLVEAPLYDRLVERLVAESRRIRIGSGMTPGVKLGPLVSAGQHRKVLDGPVAGASGGTGIGPAAARAAALNFIVAGPDAVVARVRPVLMRMGRNLFHVGQEPGQAQAVKLINNFLINTAMAATSEAINYGLRQNLTMKAILDVLNVPSGQNVATSYIFPKVVEPGTFDIGAAVEIMTKDSATYVGEVAAAGLPNAVGSLVDRIWQNMGRAHPGVDFSRLFEFVRDAGDTYDR